MTIGSRKNLAIFAKQIAFMSSMAGFGADLKNGDFRRLKFNSPINTKLSEISKEKKSFFKCFIFAKIWTGVVFNLPATANPKQK